VQFLSDEKVRRECRLCHSAAGHDDTSPGFYFLAVGRLAIDFGRHDAGGAAVNQRLT